MALTSSSEAVELDRAWNVAAMRAVAARAGATCTCGKEGCLQERAAMVADASGAQQMLLHARRATAPGAMRAGRRRAVGRLRGVWRHRVRVPRARCRWSPRRPWQLREGP